MSRIPANSEVVILAPLARERALLRRANRGVPLFTIAQRASAIDHATSLLAPHVRLVVVAGFAGGLAPELRCGDVVVDGPPHDFLPPEGCVIGTIHTAGSIVSSPEEKQRLHARTGAIAVDMELSIVREALRDRAVRVVGVRAIVDTASRTLPTWLGDVVGDAGEVRIWALARALVRDPRRPRELVWLALASHRAGRGLARATRALVSQHRPAAPPDRAAGDLMP